MLIDRGLNDKFTHSYPLFLAILVLSNIQLFPHLQNNVTKVFDDNFHLFFSCLGYYAGVVASSLFIGRTAAW